MVRVLGGLCIFSVALCTWSPFAPAQQPDQVTDVKALKRNIRQALFAREFDDAATMATELADQSNSAGDQLIAADASLRSGRVKKAVELFDGYLAKSPAAKPYLWQRGIALYFTQQYRKGVEQFDVHRTVNPNDVENAAWHFLCVAKADSPDKAKRMLLPAPGDSRPPMREVLEMFKTGDTKIVMDKMQSLRNSPSQTSADFYGHFYLGLYADALGDTETARKHLDQSVQNAPRNYMGDIAIVYSKHLAEQKLEMR